MRKVIGVMMIFAIFIAFIPFENFSITVEGAEMKKMKKKGERIEIISKRTDVSKTFSNADGTLTTEITQIPQHFKDEADNWQEIDNSLIQVSKGKKKVKNKQNSFSVEFDSNVTPNSEGLIVSEDEYEIQLNLNELTNEHNEVQKTAGSTGEISDNKITYPELFENISTEYTVGENFVKEDIILHEPSASGLPEKFSYQVSLENLTYEVIGKKIYLNDSDTGESKYIIEAPYMYDAYKPEDFESAEGFQSVPEEAKSFDIELITREENSQLFIDLVPDEKWLHDESRVYPIVIDPTISRFQESGTTDSILRSQFPTQIGGSDTEIGVGRSTPNVVRSLVRFDLTSIPEASDVLSADLNMYLSSTNNKEPIDISVHKISKVWKENEANWTNYTTASKWAIAGGDYTSAAYDTAKAISTIPENKADALVTWTLPLSNVYGWISDPSINYGLLLKSTSENKDSYKKFYSKESTVENKYKPKLVVTYKTIARLGLEDYWDYETHPLVGGTNYVNLGTSNNIIQYTDFSLMNYADFGLDFTRTYNSKNLEKSAFGFGWTFRGNQKLFIGTNTSKTDIDYQDEDGTVHVFTQKGTSYTAPVGFKGQLVKIDETTYELKSRDGSTSKFKIFDKSIDTAVNVAYLTQQTDANSNSIFYTYDSLNQLTTIRTDLGVSLTFKYRNGVIVQALSNGQEINYAYIGKHYLIDVTVKKSDSEETSTTFKYTNDALTSVVDAKGHTTSFAYHEDSAGKGIESVTEPSVDGKEPSTTNYTLDIATKKATRTSPEGEVTYYGLNDNHVVTNITTSSGEVTSYTLSNDYQVLSEKITYPDQQSYSKTYEYNALGDVTSISDSKGITSSYTYNDAGNVVEEKDTEDNLTKYEYKNNVLLTSMTAPNGEKTEYKYDSRGDLTEVKSPSGSIETYSTDYQNNQKKTVATDDTLGTSSETITDFNGNLKSYKDGKGQLTKYSYNLKNELVSVTNVVNGVEKIAATYAYDGNGNLITITNAAGKQTKLEYNAQNAITKETNGIGKATNYHYNADGNLIKITKADGSIIDYETDEETQTSKVKVNTEDQFTTKQESLVTTVTNHTLDGNRVIYTAAENGALQKIQFDSSTNQILYDYVNEQLKTVKYGSQTLDYDFNTNGQLKKLMLGNNTLADFSYDKNGLDTRMSFGNQKSAIENVYKGTSTQLQTEKFYSTSGTAPWKINAYMYDANGQITSITNENVTTTYTYDAFNQLTKETLPDGQVINYTYDTVGNRTAKSVIKNGVTITTNYTFNDANQMTNAGAQAYTIDFNGNLTNDGRYQYTWNAFDQLTGVKGETDTTYTYDENGRRVYSKVGSIETYYRYDGTSNHVLFEENASGVITKAYTYDANGHPLTMTYDDEIYYYLTNYRGDVLALTDASGTVVAEYTYDAWGNILTQTDSIISKENPYRYAGYRYDEETKLYYLMARYYNPDTGVFLSIDPVRGDKMDPITMNGYNYANNNPVMFVDPDGESAYSVFFNRLKNALLYAIGKWLSFYIPDSLYKALQDGVIAPYLLFGEKILNGVKSGIKAYVEGKKSYSYLVSDIKKTMASSRQEQQKLIKHAQNQIRKYGAKMASKILLKSVFTYVDAGIIVTYFAIGVKNRYGWRNAWK